MKRIFCGLSCGIILVMCCVAFLLSGGVVEAKEQTQGVMVTASDFATHGIALGQVVTQEQLSSAFGKVLSTDDITRWDVPLRKYTFKKDIVVYTLRQTRQVAEIVCKKDAAVGRAGVRYGATTYYLQKVYGKAPRENYDGDACFVYRAPAEQTSADALGTFAANMRLVCVVDHDNGSLTALRWTLLPLTEAEADDWALSHPDAFGDDRSTTDILTGAKTIDTSALPDAPTPELGGLTN